MAIWLQMVRQAKRKVIPLSLLAGWKEGSQGYEFATKENLIESASSGNGVDGWQDMFNY